MTKNIFFLIVTVIAAVLTLGGLGNAAFTVDKFYWVPFILDIPFFVYICVRLWRAENPKEGK